MSEKKVKVLEMMVKGVPVSHIAEELQIGRSTIYLWLKDPIFKDAKKKAEEQLLDNLWLVSMYEVEDVLLNTKDEYKKIQIFQQLAKIKGKEESTLNINQVKSVDEMLADLRRY